MLFGYEKVVFPGLQLEVLDMFRKYGGDEGITLLSKSFEEDPRLFVEFIESHKMYLKSMAEVVELIKIAPSEIVIKARMYSYFRPENVPEALQALQLLKREIEAERFARTSLVYSSQYFSKKEHELFIEKLEERGFSRELLYSWIEESKNRPRGDSSVKDPFAF